jgi:hypothetical protein
MNASSCHPDVDSECNEEEAEGSAFLLIGRALLALIDMCQAQQKADPSLRSG